ncbi:uncharacterized protein LOC144105311 isoform X1 [Amblyomma americanum]
MMSPFELATLSVVIFRSISPNLVSSEQGSYVDCTLSSKHYIYPAWQEARKHYQNSEAALAMEESDKEDPCAEEKISRCYASYLEALTSTLFLPEDEKLLKAMEGADEVRACSRLKEKLPCHKRIERCPKNITEQFSRQQESYRYIEDVVCDGSVRNGRTRRYISAIVASCVDFKELLKCKVGKLQEWKQGEESYISKSFLCKALLNSGNCVQSSLKKVCSIPFNLFKTNIYDAANALAQLADCPPKSSCQTPRASLLLLAATGLLCWKGASLLPGLK